jgi:hypothetical protein
LYNCGAKVEVIDINEVMNSKLPELFNRNNELMKELSENYEAQKEAMKQTEVYAGFE